MKVFVVSIFPAGPAVHEPTAVFTTAEEAREFARANNRNNGFSVRALELNPQWHTGPASTHPAHGGTVQSQKD